MQLHLWREGMTSAHFIYVSIECWATVRHAQCTLGAVVQCRCKHTDYSLEHLRLKSSRRSKILIQPCVRHKCTVWPSEPAAHWLAACEAGNRPSREDPQRSVPLLTWRRWDPPFIAGAFDVTKLASIRPHLNEFKWCDWTGAARETRPQQVMKRACVWECVCASVSALLG